MKIHHTRLLDYIQRHHWACLTLPNNIGRVERLLGVFFNFANIFCRKNPPNELIWWIFTTKNIRKIKKTSRSLSTPPVLLGSVKHT